MTTSNPKIKAKKPKSVWFKPIKADFKDLFKALAKGIGHTATGKWAELAADSVETLSSLGLSTEPSELAFLLIRRSITHAVFGLVGESASQFSEDAKERSTTLTDRLDFSILTEDVHIDKKFVERPAELPLLKRIQLLLLEWLKETGLNDASANSIVDRLPSYFVYALNQEWRRNTKLYRPLLETLNTPFTEASDREWAWSEYAALLQRRIQESIFDEAFSLSQIYVPLNAWCVDEKPRNDLSEDGRVEEGDRRRIVVSLERELFGWKTPTR